jgi:acyl-CoA thioester hydrolase
MPDSTGVVARTWVGDPHGPRFNRYVRIEDGEGRVCAQGITEWVLVDSITMRPHRIPADMLPTFERR